MTITGDYHTHTKYSKFNHGKNTIAEMVEAAKDKGLSFLAITDHGPRHLAFGIRRKNIKKARVEIDEINKNTTATAGKSQTASTESADERALVEIDKINKKGQLKRVYLGIEANLIGCDGKIDLTQKEIDTLDLLIVGYHRGTINNIIKPFGLFPKTKAQIERQTQAYINLVNRYDVDFITQLCEYIQVDCKRVAEACAKTDTLIEINTRHFRFTDKQMQEMLETPVKFIISSDAHRKDRVASVDNALAQVEKYNIPHERIVNFGTDYVPKKLRKKTEN